MSQRAVIESITAEGIVTLGRDGGGSAGLKGRLIVRSGGMVCWEPITDGQEQAMLLDAVQGLAPGEVAQPRPPAIGHALGEPGASPTPPAPTPALPGEQKAPEGAEPPVPPAPPSGPAAPGVTPPVPDPA